MRHAPLVSALFAGALAGCGSAEPDTADPAATVAATNGPSPGAAFATSVTTQLLRPDGSLAGTVTAMDAAEGLTLAINVEGLEPGQRGIHVHTTGRCDPPKFESAGPHWNPGMREHGLENPKGSHAGDMPNLTVGSDGKGAMQRRFEGHRLAELLDIDGSAIVIHAKADDQKTDPTGDSGGRIACGILQ